jgi:hypothetical protein
MRPMVQRLICNQYDSFDFDADASVDDSAAVDVGGWYGFKFLIT